MEPEGSLSHSPVPATCAYPEPYRHQRICPGPRHLFMFRNCASFYGEELYAPQPTNQMTTPCRLRATAYSIYSELPSILEVVPPSATLARTMPQ